jgi:hypothetical protein
MECICLLDMTDSWLSNPQQVSQWSFEAPAASGLDDAVATVRTQLARLHINLGIEDERELAERDIADALRMRDHALGARGR